MEGEPAREQQREKGSEQKSLDECISPTRCKQQNRQKQALCLYCDENRKNG